MAPQTDQAEKGTPVIDDPSTTEALWLLSEDGKAARTANRRADEVARHRAELAKLHADAKAETATLIQDRWPTAPWLPEPLDMPVIEGETAPGAELAVATQPYAKPYFDTRAWRHSDDDDWQSWTRAALRRAAANPDISRRSAAVEDAVTQLEESEPRWQIKPYATAFATPAGREFHFAPGIVDASAVDIHTARRERARRPRFDPKLGADMLRLLAASADRELEAMHIYFRQISDMIERLTLDNLIDASPLALPELAAAR